MLGSSQIRDWVERDHLIDSFNEECLRHCSYRLRIAKLILPGGAKVIESSGDGFKPPKGWLSTKITNLGKYLCPNKNPSERVRFIDSSTFYKLKPNELVIFQTRERIRMPMNLAASYSALDTIAKEGILLINASMVEPGYEGYLSGVLLNFSSRDFLIRPNMEIVKINFYSVEGGVENKLTENINDYTELLRNKAQIYTQTFLDVERLKNEVIGQTARKVRNGFVWGGFLLLLLLAYSTLEPLVYKYIWKDSWVPMNSTYIEMERSMQYQKQMEIIDSLSKRIDSLRLEIGNQDARKDSIMPKGRI